MAVCVSINVFQSKFLILILWIDKLAIRPIMKSKSVGTMYELQKCIDLKTDVWYRDCYLGLFCNILKQSNITWVF